MDNTQSNQPEPDNPVAEEPTFASTDDQRLADETDGNALSDTNSTSDDAQIRNTVASQLMRLQGLIRRFEHRVHPRTPWDDPRRGQGRVLALLKMTPEISQRELTYLLDMSKQALGELLGKLEKAGLIERKPSPDDRRVTMVRLTPTGQTTDQPGTPTSVDQILSVLSDDELAQFSDYLTRVIDALEQNTGDWDDRRQAMREEFMRRHGADPRLREEWDVRWRAEFDRHPRPQRGAHRHDDPRRARPGFGPFGGPDGRDGFQPDQRWDGLGPDSGADFGPMGGRQDNGGRPGPMGPHDRRYGRPGFGPMGGPDSQGPDQRWGGPGPREQSGGFEPGDGYDPRLGYRPDAEFGDAHRGRRAHRHHHH